MNVFNLNLWKRIWKALIGAVFLLLVFALPLERKVSAAPLMQTISFVNITDVRDGSFVVTWETNTASDGYVDWGTSTPPGNTAADSVASTTTHLVQLSGLNPSTTYYFQVRSGTTTDDNGGAYYSVTTGPSLSLPVGTKILYGTMYAVGGVTPVANGIVYIRLVDNDGSGSPGNSQWASARTDSSGLWSTNIASLRTNDLSAFFSFSDVSDNYQGVWQGGAQGLVGEVGAELYFPLPSSYPLQKNMTLDGNPTAIQLTHLEVQAAGDGPGREVSLSVLLAIAGLCLFAGYLAVRRTVSRGGGR